ncbi:hypothetical protein, partial [Desulfosarcina sp.]|uniref:hypothetical protein n=1 Tax=Desulfosarcina sp. TaxID=2027861 RepID=UPI0029A57436
HSIVWESDKLVTITVFGKADPGGTGGAISFSSPPQNYQEEVEPAAETEASPADDPEPEDASTPEAVIPGGTSAAEGAGVGNPPAVE